MEMLPRILIIDDLFGRRVASGRNNERASLCGKLLLRDITGDESDIGLSQKVHKPLAEAVFLRGQKPSCSTIGDTVLNDLDGCLAKIEEGWADQSNPTWALVLLDLCFYTGKVTLASDKNYQGMPVGRIGDDNPQQYFGMRILERINQQYPDLPVIILSSKPRDEVSRAFVEKGALGFLARDAINGSQLLEELLWRHGLFPDPEKTIVGCSKSVLLALRSARRLALQQENILLLGERGTGKELFARYIHRCSSSGRIDRPFIPVNSATFTPELFASELFGVESGTATGVTGKIGLIESANRGDIFLDEIKDMPAQVQAGVLRVLQDNKVYRVGGRNAREVEVRFLAATNADLPSLTEKGIFRADLLDRLASGGTLQLPPLRERASDIAVLTERFVREAEHLRHLQFRRNIAHDVLLALREYEWPGNIRELRRVVFDAVNSHPDVEHLVLAHIRLPDRREYKEPLGYAPAPPATRPNDSLIPALSILIDQIDRHDFDAANPECWAGQLIAIRSACARLLARALRASLLATRRPTLDCPSGEILIHPAIKLLTGRKDLSASKAADLVKWILNLSPEEKDALLADDILRVAFEIATRLRPSAPKRFSHRDR